MDVDNPSSLKMIEMLEGHLDKMLVSGEYVLGAIAINVLIRDNGENFDGIEIRIFSKEIQFIKRFRHQINEKEVKLDEIVG